MPGSEVVRAKGPGAASPDFCFVDTATPGAGRVGPLQPARDSVADRAAFTFFLWPSTIEGVVHVVLGGELDIATVSELDAALRLAWASSDVIVLDLRELEFIDSSGLRTLLTARKRAEEAGADFSLVAGHRGLERTLEIAGVHKVFDWTPAEELA